MMAPQHHSSWGGRLGDVRTSGVFALFFHSFFGYGYRWQVYGRSLIIWVLAKPFFFMIWNAYSWDWYLIRIWKNHYLVVKIKLHRIFGRGADYGWVTAFVFVPRALGAFFIRSSLLSCQKPSPLFPKKNPNPESWVKRLQETSKRRAKRL